MGIDSDLVTISTYVSSCNSKRKFSLNVNSHKKIFVYVLYAFGDQQKANDGLHVIVT